MKKLILSMVVLLMAGSGCNPYPRFRKGAVITPQETAPRSDYLTTDQYIRLGLILQRHLGKPYRGRSRWETGLDCSKFTRDVYQEFDRTILPRTALEQFKEGREVSRRRLKFGDLVFFRTEYSRVSHVGVYTGFNEFIHASTSQGVIVSNLSEKYWAERFAGARRVLSPATD